MSGVSVPTVPTFVMEEALDSLRVLSVITLPFFGLLFFILLCVSVMSVRRDHSHHVHTIWYIFSLALCSISVLFFYVYESARSIQSTPLSGMPGNIALAFMNASMDAREEVYIVITISALFIVPQMISYVISGLFGCGSPPILVSTVSKVATWSLIKFFCALSGILAAQSIFALYGRPYLYPKDATINGVEAFFAIYMSFFIMALYYKIGILYDVFDKYYSLKWFKSFSRFMTRCKKMPHKASYVASGKRTESATSR